MFKSLPQSCAQQLSKRGSGSRDSAQARPNVDQAEPMLGQFWPNRCQVRNQNGESRKAKSGFWTQIDQKFTNTGNTWLNLEVAQSSPQQANMFYNRPICAEIGPCWPKSAHFGPLLTSIRRAWSNLGRSSQLFDKCLSQIFGNFWTTAELAGRAGPTFRGARRATVRQLSGSSLLATIPGLSKDTGMARTGVDRRERPETLTTSFLAPMISHSSGA